jgi:formylglycine-generating enzyme required for sulfatase activity
MDFVPVGNAGNPADRNRFDRGAFGSVGYLYGIGKNRVTNRQYVCFLNAVAGSDSHGLYNPRMGSDAKGGILRLGAPGGFTYIVKASMGDEPVYYVGWYDALRFCNWLHNGMPTGIQGPGTTERGAYTFTGATTVGARNGDAKVFLPTEDEWYKAAYCDPTREETRGYHLRRTHGHSIPMVGNGDPGSKSAYGAAGMGGKVWEWNEAIIGRLFRGVRCGSWFSGNNIQSAGRFYSNPRVELSNIGFRVARPCP